MVSMKSLYLCFKIVSFTLVLLIYAHTGICAGIVQDQHLLRASYWQQKAVNGSSNIMNAAAIKSINEKMIMQVPTMPDLAHYPAYVTAEYIKGRIPDANVLDEELYTDGHYASEEYKRTLRELCSIDSIRDICHVKYAVTVHRANMREMPTAKGLFSSPKDTEFDVLQQTTLDPGEPVAVLHESADGSFYLIEALNYSGWISRDDIAFTTRSQWLNYIDPEDFLVVTEPNIKLSVLGEAINYQMGARLPIISCSNSSYQVLIPTRKADGDLQSVSKSIKKTDNRIHKGYLAYTVNNIIDMAFKWHGFTYGWGGFHESVDCSSLNFNILRTVGIILPRDADQQEECRVGRSINLANMSYAERKSILDKLTPGDCLYMPGHTMMYLGEINGEPYAMHALGSYYPNGIKQVVNKVVLSDLTLKTRNGNSLLMRLTSAVSFK